MPNFRKISPHEAATWSPPSSPTLPNADPAALLANLPDRRGLTRIDIAGEHAWRARVYTRSIELHRQFADSLHGGTMAALQAAIAWRDHMRKLAGPRPKKPRRWYIARADYERLNGWLAYADRRRYFSDAKYGGRGGAREAAEEWMQERAAG
ncbi:hypothetical protein SE17_18955 [Kouleothrix aurantiaca]|uniref:Uncharacterized protein n=1 Tax=Kouleothrix aurantiaca TaxID=186479 RepID=A0A0P9FFJ0_9CHLR|nr:hypothetical protein SE17_18955 [Kouleothrix aurantiaca]